MSTTTHLLTVEEYSKIPDPPGGRYELHRGELVFMSFPKRQHTRIQGNIFAALLTRCGDQYKAGMEFPCRPLPEYEMLGPDVAVFSRLRWEQTSDSDWFAGSPELVIEVLSPSNSKRDMEDRKLTFFQGGCQQFWVVDPETSTVTVATPDGSSRTYDQTECIPLEPYASGWLALSVIFAVG